MSARLKDILFGMFLGLVLGFFIGGGVIEEIIEQEAVKKGHAEYYLDKDFERQWRWKP